MGRPRKKGGSNKASSSQEQQGTHPEGRLDEDLAPDPGQQPQEFLPQDELDKCLTTQKFFIEQFDKINPRNCNQYFDSLKKLSDRYKADATPPYFLSACLVQFSTTKQTNEQQARLLLEAFDWSEIAWMRIQNSSRVQQSEEFSYRVELHRLNTAAKNVMLSSAKDNPEKEGHLEHYGQECRAAFQQARNHLSDRDPDVLLLLENAAKCKRLLHELREQKKRAEIGSEYFRTNENKAVEEARKEQTKKAAKEVENEVGKKEEENEIEKEVEKNEVLEDKEKEIKGEEEESPQNHLQNHPPKQIIL